MSESLSESFSNYTRRCLLVFVAILCGIGLMVGCSFTNLATHLRIALILVIAALNAGLVSCFLMHLLSERKFVFTVLIVTVIFFIGLMGLTMVAHGDVPHLKAI
mgnify:CR=1 FL=1